MATGLRSAVQGVLHEPTQVDEDRIHLTVDSVYHIEEAGRIDFGGGELTDAEVTEHDRYWRSEDDEYRWWRLEAGQYLVEYNESLDTETPIQLQPRRALLERGGTHPTIRTAALPRVPLSVAGDGLHLKENARISVVTTA